MFEGRRLRVLPGTSRQSSLKASSSLLTGINFHSDALLISLVLVQISETLPVQTGEPMGPSLEDELGLPVLY